MSPSAVLVRAVGTLRTAGPSISRLARAVRGRHLLVFDLVGVTAAAYMAVALRYDGFGVPGILYVSVGLAQHTHHRDCPTSAPVRQIQWLEDGRISGSS